MMPARRERSAPHDTVSRRFPDDFVWGAATSAFQIEGALTADARGPSIWDTLATQPGAIANDDDPSIACDHYRRHLEDVALMQRLGLAAYRFSLSWPRVIPAGRGPVNPAGLDFYDRLVDALLAANITPYPTLYHWELPQALQDAGGWPARATVDAFLQFVDAASRRLGDRVKRWFTINEPFCVAVLGYENGDHAPALRDPAAALAAGHHVLVAHGRAVELLRANVREVEAGIVLNLTLSRRLHRARPTQTRRATSMGCSTAGIWIRSTVAATRWTCSSTIASGARSAATSRLSCATVTSRRSRRRPTCSASTTTRA